MKTIQHTSSPLSPRAYKLLRFFRLVQDFAVENERTISVCIRHHGKTLKVPLHKGANPKSVVSRVRCAARDILPKFQIYEFRRSFRGYTYYGACALED